MKNFEMKTFKLMMLTALVAITSFSLTSCLNDNGDSSDTPLGTIAAVSYNMGYLTFTNGSLTYIPSSSSVAALEAKGADFNKYDVVYITYTSSDTYEAGKTQYNIELTGVVNLDNKVDVLNDEATLNDSINHPKMEPIIELMNWSTSGTSQYMVMMDKNHVLVYANYFLNKNQQGLNKHSKTIILFKFIEDKFYKFLKPVIPFRIGSKISENICF